MEPRLGLNQILFLAILAWIAMRGFAPLWIVGIIAAWYFGLVYLEQNGTRVFSEYQISTAFEYFNDLDRVIGIENEGSGY